MRQLSLLLLCPFLIGNAYATQSNTPTPFTGVSLYAGVGGINAEVDVNRNVQASVPSFINPALPANLQLSQTNFMGMVGLGYAYQFRNGLLLSAAFTADFTPVEVNDNATFSTDQSTIILLTSTLETKLKNDFALLFKPGYVLGNSTLFYGLIGPRWGNFESTLNSHFSLTSPPSPVIGTANGSDSTSGYSLGLTMGLGIQQLVTDNFSIGLEYAHTNYNNIPSLEVSTGIYVNGTQFGTLIDTTKLDSYTNTVMMTFSYRC